jgi:hypothetical protein
MPPILQTISPHQGRGSGLHFDLGSTRRHLSLIYVAPNENGHFSLFRNYIFLKVPEQFLVNFWLMNDDIRDNEREIGQQCQPKILAIVKS